MKNMYYPNSHFPPVQIHLYNNLGIRNLTLYVYNQPDYAKIRATCTTEAEAAYTQCAIGIPEDLSNRMDVLMDVAEKSAFFRPNRMDREEHEANVLGKLNDLSLRSPSALYSLGIRLNHYIVEYYCK